MVGNSPVPYLNVVPGFAVGTWGLSPFVLGFPGFVGRDVGSWVLNLLVLGLNVFPLEEIVASDSHPSICIVIVMSQQCIHHLHD